ncbi:HigA family addiction module antitoxin [Butyrivibrio fibrisolvens]|uniref:HigA family addiction module antitoxin n=1 Tax=Butyrivibrio fibrisolvens TaxID=831 RepID=UPI0003B3FEA1|nr:HigA family addiction module antitoxin [Butyrivibrio fibrisolvens]
MSNITEYMDIIAFHPGYYISDIIEDMGISQQEFAIRMGTTPKTVSQLVNGQANISNELAKKLSAMLGTSVELWQNLQNKYDQKIIEIQNARDFEEQEIIAKQIDYKYFEEIVGLPSAKSISDRVRNLCAYFKISDLRILREPDFLVNFRSGASCNSEKNIINSRAWIQTAINISSRLETKKFDSERLKRFLPELRSMTVQKPEVFMPRMCQIFSECGVAFVLLPHLRNSGVNGAVKWINGDRVVLAMNNRGLDADRFWFSLFHEIKHVLQQKTKTLFVSCNNEEKQAINSKLEMEADKFARNYLIPPEEYRKLTPNRYITDEEIVAFAKMIGIHPGIVVGRLQHDNIIPHNRCGKLKEKYVFVVGK